MPQDSLEDLSAKREVRATQKLVSHMAFVWRHPSLTVIEVAWRWMFGIPFLLVVLGQAQGILQQVPLASVGFDRLDWQNPWLSSVLIAEAIGRYEPLVWAVLRWLVPVGVVGWAVISAIGRMLVLARMSGIDSNDNRAGYLMLPRLPRYATLQALWLAALLGCVWLWYRAVGWASATYITAGGQPQLEIYLCWLIFFSLAFYVLWAITSWTLAVAPLLLVLEPGAGGIFRGLTGSFRLRRMLSSKLMEVSLVMAIVRIMLIVLAMVLSAAPLPFQDEFGAGAMHGLYVVIAIVYLIGSDYFHVVRIRSFVELWRAYRAAC